MLRLLAFSLALTAFGFGADTAAAQRAFTQNHIHGVRPEIHFDAGFHGYLGAGFDLEIPIVPDGVLRGMDDEIAIVPGFDFLFYDFVHDGPHGLGFAPQVTAQWTFYVSRRWSVFPEVGATVLITTEKDHPYFHRYGKKGKHFYADPVGAFGARFHINQRNALVFRIGYPFGGQIGFTF